MGQGSARASAEVVAEVLPGSDEAGVTVKEIADRCGLAESTVGKALGSLEAAGTACRQAGGREGGRRRPDRWSRAAAPAISTGEADRSERGTDPRLAPGELRSLVLARLAAETEPAGPSVIARALQRSAGATANSLERLVDLGLAERVSDRPRRYRAIV